MVLSQCILKNSLASVRLLSRAINTLPQKDFKNDLKKLHNPVMVNEIIDVLNPQASQNILDMTFGAGGHSREILQRCPTVNLFALDRDPLAHLLATNLAKENPQVKPMLGCFSEVKNILRKSYGVTSLDGIILDAGVSSMQFDEADRGFSLNKDGPLDMRMDQDKSKNHVTAYDVVNRMSEENLMIILKKYGEEKNSRMIARAIIDYRYSVGAIKSTHQLADIVCSSFPSEHHRHDKLDRPSHLATKTFQAIRIFVNDEMNELDTALNAAHQLLVPGGVCAVLTFHSLEDRIVKRHFHGIAMNDKLNESLKDKVNKSLRIYKREELEDMIKRKWEVIHRRITWPSDEEISSNPRSRSAKLRYAFKVTCE